ncbi:MAG: DotA/TraY family protein [Acetobacteraceae bacterium]
MRLSRIATFAASAAAFVAVAAPALAQSSPYNVSWASLTPPATDFSVTVLHSLFPIPGNPAGQATGNEATAIGQIVGQFTGFVAAIACAFVIYNVIMNIHRAAESSQILGSGQSWMFVVRTGFAAIMMFPLGSGFSAGQQMVMQAAMWGAGMASALYTNAITAIGPDAAVIATPMIPGTQTVVAGLINNELCMDLVNLAANTPSGPLMPTPAALTVNDGTGGGYVSYRYALSTGNEGGDPACGTVTIREPSTNATTVAGVSVDMAAVQSAVLNNVLSGIIRPQVATIAQQLWQTKTIAPLAGIQNVYTQAVSSYTQGLTNAATSLRQNINAALAANATTARGGGLDLVAGGTEQSTLGWTSAGAYYLEIARANAATLSLLTSIPVTTEPTWDGLPPAMSYDLAPFESMIASFMSTLQTVVNTSDGIDQPSGSPTTLEKAEAANKGLGIIDKVLRQLELNGQSMNTLQGFFGQNNAKIWTDPFGGLMDLGQTLIIIALAGLGIAAVLSSATASTATTIWHILTLDWGAAAATAVGHALMSFLAGPIYLLMMAIMVPGVLLAYVLPMIPFIMWIAGVCGWLILVCEALIAVPLWMLAHMTVGGDGLHGRGIEGWGLLFNVLFRPVLMLIGLFLSYFVFDCMSWLLRQSFGIASGFVLDNGSIVTNWLGMVVLMNIFVMTNVLAALMSFRMIALIPHHLPRLIGFNSASRVDMDDFAHRGAYGPGMIAGQGIQRTLGTGSAQYTAGMGQLLGSRQRLIGGAAGVAGGQADSSMDTTLRATTDTGNSSGDDA